MTPASAKPAARNARILRALAAARLAPIVYHPKDDPATPDVLRWIGEPPEGFGA